MARSSSRPRSPRSSGPTRRGETATPRSATPSSVRTRCTSTCRLGTWAADGLLAVFFLVAGIELKREFVAGDLSDRRKAALPIAAAVCGVALPAVLFVGHGHADEPGRSASEADGIFRGWAIPTATDIAFALAVLAVIGTHLPSRAPVLPADPRRRRRPHRHHDHRRLLHRQRQPPLAAGRRRPPRRVAPPAQAEVDQPRRCWRSPPCSPGASCTRAASTRPSPASCSACWSPFNREEEDDPDRQSPGRAHRAPDPAVLRRVRRPGLRVLRRRRHGRSVAASARRSARPGRHRRRRRARRRQDRRRLRRHLGGSPGSPEPSSTRTSRWTDVLGLSVLAGVGFTVSACSSASSPSAPARRGTTTSSSPSSCGSVLIAALLAAVVLRLRNRHYRLVEAEETRDDDPDGVPDVYARPDPAIGS